MHPHFVRYRRIVYVYANLVEAGVAWAFAVACLFALVDRNDTNSLTVVWGSPWDTVLICCGGAAATAILACMLVFAPSLRVGAEVILALYLVSLAASTYHVRGFSLAAQALAAYAGPAVALIGRAIGVIAFGDYPPPGRFPRVADHLGAP